MLSDVGITRIKIVSEKDIERAEWSRLRCPAANNIYRHVFARYKLYLLDGEEEFECSKDSVEAYYDVHLGIDVFLRYAVNHYHHLEASLQEKFLTYDRNTVTCEYMQDHRRNIRGDWFKPGPAYYFVGYDRNDSCEFDNWILLDWPAIKEATAQHRVNWYLSENGDGKARASFLYADFDNIPNDCIIARCINNNIELVRPIIPRWTYDEGDM